MPDYAGGYGLARPGPASGLPREGVVFPVRMSLRCRLGVRPAQKFEVPDGLSRAGGLFEPLRHFTLTAPGVTTGATVASCVRPRRRGCQKGRKVIRADAQVIHAVAEIRDHAVPLPFVHREILWGILPAP
jgi:hypothetical protein